MQARLNIVASIMVLVLAAFSIGGATVAWFTTEFSSLVNVFTAGTVIVSEPVLISQTNPDWVAGPDGKKCNTITWSITNEGTKTAYIRVRPELDSLCVIDYQNFCEWPEHGPIDLEEDFGFVPNSGEASISKADLLTGDTVARYWTAPRLGDNGNTIHPGAWRTSRLQVDFEGNAWVLNTGADIYLNDPSNPNSGYRTYDPATGLVGSVVRLQGDTAGLSNTNSDHANPLPFGTDEAIKIFDVGDIGDIPRAIAISYNNEVWVGFYGGKYFQKYQYDTIGETLTPVGARVTGTVGVSDNFAPYDAKIDCNGVLWFTSRDSIPSVSPRVGVFSFNTNLETPVVTRHADFNPYSVFVDPDNIVWVTAYNSLLYRSDGTYNPNNLSSVTITGSSQLRGLTQDYDGNLWIASSGNARLYKYNPLSPGDTSFVSVGTRPVGVGRDGAGYIWAVCRNDGAPQGRLDRIDPNDPGGVIQTTLVGNRPYVYSDFTKPIPPECEDYISWSLGPGCVGDWYEGVDGWWYYGTVVEPTIVPSGESVEVCFTICVLGSYDGSIDVSLIAEAVQTTHGAIDYTWPENPWLVFNPYPSLRVTKVADKETAFVGETINYTITVTNNGNVPFADVSVTDGMLAINEETATLPVGGSQVFNGSHEVVAGDMPGPLENTALASALHEGQPVSASASTSVTLTDAPNPLLSVTKTADRETASVGETINYTIVVTNTGNVILSDIEVIDDLLEIDITIDSLNPAASEIINESYTVLESDLPGPLVNTASASAEYNSQPVSANDSASVTLTGDPPIPFADLYIGDYVLIRDNGDYLVFQKIGNDQVLLRGVSGTASWGNAISAGISYSANFAPTVVASSRLLDIDEAEDLLESILTNGQNWWTSSEIQWFLWIWHGLYINTAGETANNWKTTTYGIRPSLFLQSGLFVTGGDGTAGDPYILIIPD